MTRTLHVLPGDIVKWYSTDIIWACFVHAEIQTQLNSLLKESAWTTTVRFNFGNIVIHLGYYGPMLMLFVLN